jgi:hypothetical protein
MSDEIIEETAPAFEPYESSLGTVTGVEGDYYIINTIDGKVIGVRANGEPSADNIEADIANPAPAPVAVPQEVTRRQIFLALLATSSSLTRAAIRGGLVDEAALIEFDEAITFKRTHPLVAALASSLGLSDAEVDAIFIAAAAL